MTTWQSILDMASLLRHNDLVVDDLVKRQVVSAEANRQGSVPDIYGIHHPYGSSGLINRCAVSWSSEGSRHHKSAMILERMIWAAQHLLSVQHTDGSIDLLTTNFQSAPDTAFSVEPMAMSYKLLQHWPEANELSGLMETFLRRAGEALITGGIHTPNHRWVICMALARLYDLWPDDRYLSRAEQWLAEGIDIDADGQYAERSTAVYSPLTNRCLITVARLLHKFELYEPVRRNLDLTCYLLHANGELVTEISTRQDQYLVRRPDPYLYGYMYMARLDRSGTFAQAARAVSSWADESSRSAMLPFILEDTALSQLPAATSLPTHFWRYFPAGRLVRFREGMTDSTILSGSSILLTMHHGSAVLQGIRMASAFFGKGQFVPTEMQVSDRKVVLSQEFVGPYYQLFPADQLPDDGDWDKMPRDQRPQSELQTLQYKLEISQTGRGFNLTFEVTGTYNVPIAIELNFREGGSFEGVSWHHEAETFLVEDREMARYAHGTTAIAFGPGLVRHKWTRLRGALSAMPGQSVYLTGYSPMRHTLRLEPVDL